MKRGWKIFWIVCLVTALMGGGLMAAGLFMGANIKDLNTRFGGGEIILVDDSDEHDEEAEVDEGYEIAEEVHAYEGIHKISVEVAAVELYIHPSMTEEVMVETSGLSSKLKFKCEQDGDELRLRSVTKMSLLSGIGKAGKVTLYIPEDQMEYVKIEDGAGTVQIESICTKVMKLDIGAGEAEILDCQAEELELNCGAGQITAKADVAGDVDIECGVGEINLKLKGAEEDFDFDVDCGIGEVEMGSQSYEGLAGEHHEHHGSDKKVSVECGIGEVHVSYY